MRDRAVRLGLALVATIGLAAAVAPTARADTAVPCRRRDFCLFSGPHQSGRVLYRVDVKVRASGFTFPDVDALAPPVRPRSVRNPIPDGLGCVVRLDDKAHFAGEEQEVVGGDGELSGAAVASMTADCG